MCSRALEIWHSQIPRCECRVDATEAGRARLILPPAGVCLVLAVAS